LMTEQGDAPTPEQLRARREIEQLQKQHWPDPEPKRMTAQAKAEFFDAFCNGQIFTDRHCVDPRYVGVVFLPLGMCTPMPDSYAAKVGVVWQHLSKAGPRAVEGMPMFDSIEIMHREDWDELRAKIQEEREHRRAVREKIERGE